MWASFLIKYLSSSLRYRSTREALYWQGTNNVRRNLLMAAAKRTIYDEWDPGQETYQNLAELRSLANERLTAAIVSSVQCQVRGMSTDYTSFSGQPYRFRPVSSTFSSSPRLLIRSPLSDTTIPNIYSNM